MPKRLTMVEAEGRNGSKFGGFLIGALGFSDLLCVAKFRGSQMQCVKAAKRKIIELPYCTCKIFSTIILPQIPLYSQGTHIRKQMIQPSVQPTLSFYISRIR